MAQLVKKQLKKDLVELEKVAGLDQAQKRNAEEFIGFLGFFYALPIFLLTVGILPFNLYYPILMIMGLLLVSYAIQKGITSPELGLTKKGWVKAMIQSLGLSLILAGVLIASYKLGIVKAWRGETGSLWFLLFYVFVSAPIQEFIFRSLMFYELMNFFGERKWTLIILSAGIFALAHAFFQSWGVIIVTFMAGLVWGDLYYKNRNFWSVALSHAVLGGIAVILGVV